MEWKKSGDEWKRGGEGRDGNCYNLARLFALYKPCNLKEKKKRIIIGSPIRADRNRVRRARIARSHGILNKFRIVSGGGSLTAILRGGEGATIKERSFTVAMFRQSLSFIIIIITISETFLLFSMRKEFLLYFYLFRERERERDNILSDEIASMNFRQFREFLLLSRVSVTGSCNVARFSRGIFDNILRVFGRIPLQIGVAEFFGGRSSRFDQRLSSLWRRLSISEKRLSIERSIDLSISLFLSFFGYHRRANEMMAEHASR